MATLLTMPSLSPTMETGVITSWMKKVGDFIDIGEVLAEVETDKAVMEYEMVDEGYVREFLVEPGQEVAVGTPIAIMAESLEEDIAALKQQAASGKVGNAGPAPAAEAPAAAATPVAALRPTAPRAPAVAASATQTLPVIAAPLAPAALARAASAKLPQAPPLPRSSGSNGTRLRISPYARKLAQEQSIDPSALQGSGPGGRIVAKDIEAALASGAGMASGAGSAGAPLSAPAAPRAPSAPVGTPFLPAPAPGGAAYEDQPLSMMRKAIARKMAESKATVPHFQLTRKIRAEALLDGRARLKREFPELKVTVNDIIVKACAMALMQHPTVNSQFLGDRVRRFNTADVAVAVGTDDGLITPIVFSAHAKGLATISAEIKHLAQKAKDKKLAPEDYTGGTFTVSNLGMYGVTEFNGIINTPQACILAVSGAIEEPVVEDGQLAVGRTMNMTLSSDHRVVDGLVAAQFMDTLARMLENPLAMLL